jgi:hypothetical protein
MKKFEGKISIILPLMALSLLSFSYGKAHADYPSSEKDSVYLYNALENKESVDEMLANKDIALLLEDDKAFEESLPVSVRTSYTNRRSELLDPAEFEIALKELTIKENSILKDTEKEITRVSRKTELGTVILGNNLGTLEFELVQVKGLQGLFNSLIPKTTDVSVKMDIRDHIDTLKEEQKKVETLLYQKENNFSLLGWLVATI